MPCLSETGLEELWMYLRRVGMVAGEVELRGVVDGLGGE